MPNAQSDHWYQLDNAARLFPSVTTASATNMFRLSCRLKEDVKPDLLQKAAEETLAETPSFQVRLRKGVFWYFFEGTAAQPEVKPESVSPCRRLDRFTNNGLLFDVTYQGKYIHCEFFHALCDGTGGVAFLTHLVCRYLVLAHPEALPPVLELPDSGVSHSAQNEDSFVRVARDKEAEKETLLHTPKGYKVWDPLLPLGQIHVIKGILSLSQIKEAAKERKVTITALLSGVLIYSYYQEKYRFSPRNRPVNLCIPVNLRRFFPSETLRNFFLSVTVGVDYSQRALDLEETIQAAAQCLAKELDSDALCRKMTYTVGAQKNLLLRFVPLFLKNIVLKRLYASGEKGFTSVLSNLGAFQLPPEAAPYVERFEFIVSPTLITRVKTAACSFEDAMVYCFASCADSVEVQRRFFLTLREIGVDVVISCNVPQEEPQEEKAAKGAEKPSGSSSRRGRKAGRLEGEKEDRRENL